MNSFVPARNGHPAVKRDRVVQYLRRLIVDGKVLPTERMPTHKELERRFDAESPTIRAAMRVLSEDGFIETRHRRGSFVASHPPHLTQFAFAYPFNPDRIPSRFFSAIHDEAERWQNPERRVLSFYDVHLHTDVEDYQRLLRYVQSNRLAGLIFTNNPFGLRRIDSPLIGMSGLPRVTIAMQDEEGGIPKVYPDLSVFLPKAFDYLAAHGRKRVAVVKASLFDIGDELVRIPALAAKRGLVVHPDWIQAMSLDARSWVRQLGRLLVRGAPGERPDSLVITDDNLVPELTAGLSDSGVPVRACGEPGRLGDLVVVAHTNFPHPTPSAVPVTRLGYDIRELVAVCMERIDQQRRGEISPAHTTIPAVFEEELKR